MLCIAYDWKVVLKDVQYVAILLDYTFQTSSPFIDTAINERLRRAPLIHDCLFQLFHSFIHSSQYIHYCRVWTVCRQHRRLDKSDFSLCSSYLMVFDSVRWRTVLLQKHVVWIYLSCSLTVNIFNFCIALFDINCRLCVPKLSDSVKAFERY